MISFLVGEKAKRADTIVSVKRHKFLYVGVHKIQCNLLVVFVKDRKLVNIQLEFVIVQDGISESFSNY